MWEIKYVVPKDIVFHCNNEPTTTEKCESQCNRYYSCDKILNVDNVFKLLEGETCLTDQ
jgi:hypothetical protein